MERSYRGNFEEALRRCQKVIEGFEGSEETLMHIRRIEASLRRLVSP